MAVHNLALPSEQAAIVYPSSDGKPMAENTLQFRWIVTVQGGLDALFANDPNVFVAGDLLWYPIKGDAKISIAPDTMIAFGRPKGDRLSYLQWEEDGIAPQVVFAILSPGNSKREMVEKLRRYDEYGVEEYYVYDPDRFILQGWLRAAAGDWLLPINAMDGWTSPRLGVRFQKRGGQPLELYGPDGRRFSTYLELEAKVSETERERDFEKQRAGEAEQRADRLEEMLRSAGIDPNSTLQ